MKKLYFARINRRPRRGTGQSALGGASFHDELSALVASRDMIWQDDKAGRTWIAADLQWTPDGNFVTGILGFKESRVDIDFDEDAWSWSKGAEEERDSASDRTLVPFAIDANDDYRFVAFIPTARLKRGGFRRGLKKVLQAAVATQGILGNDWEVDLVVEEEVLRAWVAEHPLVFRLTRVVKFTNPGRQLDEDRRRMEQLDANRKRETFSARRGQSLDTGSQEFEEAIEGIEEGFVDVTLASRAPSGRGQVTFSTNNRAAGVDVDPGPTSEMQVSTALDHVRGFHSSRQARQLSDG